MFSRLGRPRNEGMANASGKKDLLGAEPIDEITLAQGVSITTFCIFTGLSSPGRLFFKLSLIPFLLNFGEFIRDQTQFNREYIGQNSVQKELKLQKIVEKEHCIA